MALISKLRHFARTLATQVPILHQIRGTGAGRLLARISPIERITIDDTIVIELDLRVPQFRGYFFGNTFALESDLLLIPRLLSGDSVVVDIGAHIGVYALLAAKYAARVIAFEPAPETYRRMRANIALNPRLAPKIEVHQIALSDHPGMLDFYYVESDPWASGLKKPEFGRQTHVISVPAQRLDDVLGEEQISFLKIDVEGAELEALCGAYRLLRRNQPLILCELMESYHQRFGRSVSDLIGYLNDLGYRGFEVNIGPRSSAQLCVQPLQPEKLIHNPKIFLNGLFIPASQVEHVLARLGGASVTMENA